MDDERKSPEISEADLRAALREMRAYITEAGSLSMLDLDSKSGFKDVLRHILGEPVVRHKLGDKVGDIMTAPAIVIGPDVDIREAAKTLVDRRIKRLPVVDEQGRLIGIIARADIVGVVAR